MNFIEVASTKQQEKTSHKLPREGNGRTFDELQKEAEAHMADHGFDFSGTFDTSGKEVKFAGRSGDPRKTEWYKADRKIHSNGKVGLQVTYNSFHDELKSDKNYVFTSKMPTPLNESERNRERERVASMQQNRAIEEAKNEENRKAKATSAKKRFSKASENGFSPYLERKGVKAHGIRFEKNLLNGKEETILLIPLRDETGSIQALQEIYSSKRSFKGEERDKNFTNAIKGLFHIIDEIKDDKPIFICEGYATAASVYESTGCPTVVALSCANLDPVIAKLRSIYKKQQIVIAADNDRGKNGNAGKTAAEKAAKNHPNCLVVLPVFPEDCKLQDETLPKDFNDLMLVRGKDEVAKQLNRTNESMAIQVDLKKLAFNLLEKEEPCNCFSLEALPKHLKIYISEICQTTNAHPIMITASVLTTLSAFLQKRVFMPEGESGYFQTLYTNQWNLCVTKSGQFKTTALNKGAHLAWERSNEVSQAIRKYESQKKLAPEKGKSNKIDEELLELSLQDVVLPNKITTEAFLEYLGHGHSGAIFTSEFGAWLQNMEKNHNADLKAVFTDLYDVPQRYRYKTKTQGDYILEKPCFSICGVSTMPWLKENLKPDDVSSGFFARFLLFTPPHQDDVPPALPAAKKIDLSTEKYIKNTISNMADSHPYKLSPSARCLFETLHADLYGMVRNQSDRCQAILDPYLKRWSPYLLKLAMLMRPFEDPSSSEISDTAINSAMAILLPAIKSTVQLFEGELGESEHQRKCRIMFEWICMRVTKTGRAVKWGEIVSSHKLEGGSMEYDYVFKTLIESDRLIYKESRNRKEDSYMPKNQQVEKDENG